jgi:hypothetical protein
LGAHVLSGTNGGVIRCFERDCGRVVWETSVGGPVTDQFRGHGTFAWTNGHDAAYKLDLATGAIVDRVAYAGREIILCETLKSDLLLRSVETQSRKHPLTQENSFRREYLTRHSAQGTKWESLYPPNSGSSIHFDEGTNLVYENSFYGLGFVNPADGSRLVAISNFDIGEDLPDGRVSLPLVTEEFAYVVSSSGKVLCLRIPSELS